MVRKRSKMKRKRVNVNSSEARPQQSEQIEAVEDRSDAAAIRARRREKTISAAALHEELGI